MHNLYSALNFISNEWRSMRVYDYATRLVIADACLPRLDVTSFAKSLFKGKTNINLDVAHEGFISFE